MLWSFYFKSEPPNGIHSRNIDEKEREWFREAFVDLESEFRFYGHRYGFDKIRFHRMWELTDKTPLQMQNKEKKLTNGSFKNKI